MVRTTALILSLLLAMGCTVPVGPQASTQSMITVSAPVSVAPGAVQLEVKAGAVTVGPGAVPVTINLTVYIQGHLLSATAPARMAMLC